MRGQLPARGCLSKWVFVERISTFLHLTNICCRCAQAKFNGNLNSSCIHYDYEVRQQRNPSNKSLLLTRHFQSCTDTRRAMMSLEDGGFKTKPAVHAPNGVTGVNRAERQNSPRLSRDHIITSTSKATRMKGTAGRVLNLLEAASHLSEAHHAHPSDVQVS